MKVFVGLTEIAGYSSGLSRGLVELGHDVSVAVVDPHPFAYESAGAVPPPRPLRWAMRLRRVQAPRFASVPIRVLARLLVAASLPTVIARYDVVVLLFGTRFVSVHEGRLARILGCRFVHVFLGSDARPASIDSVFVDPADPSSRTRALHRERRTRRRVRGLENASSLVIALPAYAHFLRQPFASYHAVGFPVVRQPLRVDRDDGGPLRVLHAPSHPRGKGTTLIREAVALVREAGQTVEFSELQSVTNEQVKDALRNTDVLLDQAFTDTPLASLGCEAASFGVLTVVGTLHRHPLWTAAGPPSIVVSPEELAQVLFDLCCDPSAARALGRAAQVRIAEMWSPRVVAERLLVALDRRDHQLHGHCCNAGFGNHLGSDIAVAPPVAADQRSPEAWVSKSAGSAV